MSTHGPRAGEGLAQGGQGKSSGIDKNMRKKQKNDAFTKPNRTDTKLVLPNILLIGAQKAGTTTVASWLYRNGVCDAEVFENEPSYYSNEVHFFDKFYKHGIKYYAKRFEHCIQAVDHTEFILDATPNYLPHAQRVYDTYDNLFSNTMANLKLMVILREPISRELSLYNHKVTSVMNGGKVSWMKVVLFKNGTVKSFDEYTLSLKDDIIRGPQNSFGFYVDHLRTWVELFGRQQLLILSYDELLRDPSKLQSRINSFLGVNFTGHLHHENRKWSKSKVEEINAHAAMVLEPLFRDKNEELYEFIRQHPEPPMEQSPFPRFDNVSVQ
ncbi:hypothetical protein ACHAW6_008202 [Cyclotella cf. meneghiniana]